MTTENEIDERIRDLEFLAKSFSNTLDSIDQTLGLMNSKLKKIENSMYELHRKFDEKQT